MCGFYLGFITIKGGEMSEQEAQDEDYVEVWNWQCPTCCIVSGTFCGKDDPEYYAPHCCEGVKMLKTRICIKKEEPWP